MGSCRQGTKRRGSPLYLTTAGGPSAFWGGGALAESWGEEPPLRPRFRSTERLLGDSLIYTPGPHATDTYFKHAGGSSSSIARPSLDFFFFF